MNDYGNTDWLGEGIGYPNYGGEGPFSGVTDGNLFLPLETEQIFEEMKNANANTNTNVDSDKKEREIDRKKENKYNRCMIGITVYRPRYLVHRHAKDVSEVGRLIAHWKKTVGKSKRGHFLKSKADVAGFADAALPKNWSPETIRDAPLYIRLCFFCKAYTDKAPEDKIIYDENSSLLAMTMALLKLNSKQKYYQQHLYNKNQDFKVAKVGGVNVQNNQEDNDEEDDDYDIKDNNDNNNGSNDKNTESSWDSRCMLGIYVVF